MKIFTGTLFLVALAFNIFVSWDNAGYTIIFAALFIYFLLKKNPKKEYFRYRDFYDF